MRHLVVGAGPVGLHVAEELVRRGENVTLASRSGRTSTIEEIPTIRVDASDPEALSEAATGADVLYNCVNPGDYTQWETQWPPIAKAFLEAAEHTGATYAITSSLYAYGPVSGPIHEGLPDAATDHKGQLRARMWAEAKAAHEAGKIRAVEVRASDYMGRGIGKNGHISRQLPAARRGRAAWVFERKDVPHTFTDVADVARTLIAAAADPAAHGRVWIVPSNEPRTQEEALRDVFAAAGLRQVPVRQIPQPLLSAASLVSPFVREIQELAYQWRSPYLLDDSAARKEFGIEPAPWLKVCQRTAGAVAANSQAN